MTPADVRTRDDKTDSEKYSSEGSLLNTDSECEDSGAETEFQEEDSEWEDVEHHTYGPCADPSCPEYCLRTIECCCRSAGFWGPGERDTGIRYHQLLGSRMGVIFEDEEDAE